MVNIGAMLGTYTYVHIHIYSHPLPHLHQAHVSLIFKAYALVDTHQPESTSMRFTYRRLDKGTYFSHSVSTGILFP